MLGAQRECLAVLQPGDLEVDLQAMQLRVAGLPGEALLQVFLLLLQRVDDVLELGEAGSIVACRWRNVRQTGDQLCVSIAPPCGIAPGIAGFVWRRYFPPPI